MSKVAKREKFKMTREHIKLLSSFYIDWCNCEFGSPCVDPKRPFGNSDVISDIGRILKIKPKEEESPGEYVYSEEQENRFLSIHLELQTALQIVLCTKSFRIGNYEKMREFDDRSWRRRVK